MSRAQSPDIETSTGAMIEGMIFYKAAIEEDVEKVLGILGKNGSLLYQSLCHLTGDTLLHLSVRRKQFSLVYELLGQPQFRLVQNKQLKTAFCVAVESGDKAIVKLFTEGGIIGIEEEYAKTGDDKLTALTRAVNCGHVDVALYLFDRWKDWLKDNAIETVSPFISSIRNEMFDLGLLILAEFPELELDCARTPTLLENKYTEETALHILARNASLFSTEKKWTEVIFTCGTSTRSRGVKRKASCVLKELLRRLSTRSWTTISSEIELPTNIVFEAVEAGNYNFIVDLLGLIPFLRWQYDAKGFNILHCAVHKRDKRLFNLIYKMDCGKDLMQVEVEDGSNVLHIVGALPAEGVFDNIFGEALQLQNEILWFKEVEKLSLPSQRSKMNSKGKSPEGLFFEAHAPLSKKAAEWIRTTSAECCGVSALMTSLVFPSVSSNLTNNSAIERFQDVLKPTTLFTSILSLGFFITVIAYPYRETGFVRVFPYRFRLGLLCLLISMLSMTLIFLNTLILLFTGGYERVFSFDEELLRIAAFNLAGPIFMLILFIFVIFPFCCTVFRSSACVVLRH